MPVSFENWFKQLFSIGFRNIIDLLDASSLKNSVNKVNLFCLGCLLLLKEVDCEVQGEYVTYLLCHLFIINKIF